MGMAAGVAFLALLGPTPGYVGTCGGTVAPPDASESCTRLRSVVCVREQQAGRITSEQYRTCSAEAAMRCAGTWTGCTPTRTQIDTCYSALGNPSRLSERTESIAECEPSIICLNLSLTSTTSALTDSESDPSMEGI